MPTLALSPTIQTLPASATAFENWKINLNALAVAQPQLVELLGESAPRKDWVFARDGSITAMEPNGRWWADCSVPLLASRAILKTLQSGAACSCVLCPGNAGMVVAARERIGPWATLIVVQPDLEIGRMIMACQDFSGQIRQHRLWLVTGGNWRQQLRRIFSDYPGLATPVQFIRTNLTPAEVVTPVIREADAVFSEVTAERGQQIAGLQAEAVTVADRRKILLIGAGQFRLWEDGAAMLHAQLANTAAAGGLSIQRFDTDEPLAGSPLALLKAARACGCVITANLCRPDCNHLISSEIPWITWMTTPGAPPFESAGPKDWLILADPAWRTIARKAGWPEHRVRICGFPPASPTAPKCSPAEPRTVQLALLSNTCRIEIPQTVKEFSSHRLLWDLIEEELETNPFAVENIEDYLTNRSGQLNIAVDALDRRSFIRRLILPAYEQGLARILITAGVPLSLWGEGWSELEEFAANARGPLPDREAFNEVVAKVTAFIHCWPEKTAHPIESTGKPVIHRTGNDRAQFLRNVQRSLADANRRPQSTGGSKNSLSSMLLELIFEQ